MTDELRCWRCGKGLEALSLPLSRLDECPDCTVHLHVCRMCVNFDPVVSRACREDAADEVLEKERANFCDYFQPSANAFDQDIASADQQARDQLSALFGDGGSSKDKSSSDPDELDDSAGKAADDLFK
ncbi:MAG: hypothetical protein ACR2QG_09440 [Gammaproteobacteria bacterium]